MIIGLIVFLWCQSAFGQQILWMDEANINKVKAQDPTIKHWGSQSTCVADTGGPCFDVTGKDLRCFKVTGGLLVDDPAGCAQAGIDDQAKKDEAQARKDKALERESSLVDCVAELAKPSAAPPPVVEACLLDIIREIKAEVLPIESLGIQSTGAKKSGN